MAGLILMVISVPVAEINVGYCGDCGLTAVCISPIGLHPLHPIMFYALYLTL